jgi:GT2 family glycosyltransferase
MAYYQNAATIRLARKMAGGVDRVLPPETPVRRLASRSVHLLLGMRGTAGGGGPRPELVPEVVTRPPAWVPASASPLITVIIPVHGQWAMTSRCLHSLVNARTDLPIDVLVIDDASDDETPSHVGGVQGLHTIRLDENVGFTRACNVAAAEAKGDYIVFLNNDTEVQPGWLDALYETVTSSDDIGIVGARLLYPDGTLQEAGGIIFADGNGWNYGRGFAGDDPRALHRRDVDYVSGAALLVKRELFERLGGFDDRYAPAYYEDVDLAFSAREAGLRVVYEPTATVVHDEGGSHGTDVSVGLKRYQERNRAVLVEKWRRRLADHGAPGDAIDRLRVFGAPPRIVVIDHMVPRPDCDAGSRRMRILLDILQERGYAVTFVPDNGAGTQPYTSEMRARGIEVLTGSAPDQLERLGGGVDAFIVSRLVIGERWMTNLRQSYPDTPVLFDTVDLHHVREGRLADLLDSDAARSTARGLRRRELAMVAAADATLVVSDVERDALLAEMPSATVGVVPTIEPPADRGPGFEARSGLLFVGSFEHPPNADAVVWFAREVLPLIRARIPEARLRVVGSGPLEENASPVPPSRSWAGCPIWSRSMPGPW